MSSKQTKRPGKSAKSAIQALRRQMQREGLFKDNLMRLGGPEEPKLSGLLLQLIRPFKMQNLGKLETQNLFDSELITWLEEMAEAAYPELLQNANATDEKRRIAENTLWEQAIKTRAQRKLGLEWEELSSATVLDFKRAYFLMGLMTASDFTDRLLGAIKATPADVLD